MKSRFDYDKPWSFKDLTKEEIELAEEQGCEPGKYYIGEPLEDHEVPVCWYCKTVIWDKSKCCHLLFKYDYASGEYLEINSAFQEYALSHLIPRILSELDDDDIDFRELLENAIKQNVLPMPQYLADLIREIEVYGVYGYFGGTGTEYGFAPDTFLEKYLYDGNKK